MVIFSLLSDEANITTDSQGHLFVMTTMLLVARLRELMTLE